MILSDGGGYRLWPSSKITLPKQFISFRGVGNLFHLTLSGIPDRVDLGVTIVSNKTPNSYAAENYLSWKEGHL